MSDKKRKVFSFGFFLLSIVFIVFGAYRGEIETVFSKAIRICLECIGIG